MEVKVFVLVDNEVQFDVLCSRYRDDSISFELLEDVDQLEDYSNAEIWDCRKLSKDIESAGYEIATIM